MPDQGGLELVSGMDLSMMKWGTCNKKLIITVLHNMLSKDAFLEDNHNEAQHMGSVPYSRRVVKKSVHQHVCNRWVMGLCTQLPFFSVM